MSRPPPLPPPFLRAVEDVTEPGLGALALRQENARLMEDNARLRRERNEARAEKTSTAPPPRRGKGLAVGAAAGSGLFLALRLVLRAVADQWPEYAPLAEALLGMLGGL